MDRPKRRNMVLDLRTMDDKIRLWLGAEDLDEDDRQALETVSRSDQRPDQQARLTRSWRRALLV